MSTLFDLAQRICRGDSPPPPVARLIGFTLTFIAPGQAHIEFEAGAQHANPMGTLHGGILCDIADAAMGRRMPAPWARAKRSLPSSSRSTS